ncbi:hypothetical protein [Kiloniella sp.]|uniref:DUF7683 domain-containing protein n=1 Tax=Kiloniella sp. TaxID=1938587 RepID=UPI003A91399F
MTVPVFVRFYDKVGDTLRGEIDLPETHLRELRVLFDEISEDDVYGCYPVSDKEKDFILSKIPEFNFDFNLYDYFIEVRAG